MSYIPRYMSGNWKAICDSCGRQFPASELQKRWDGLMVCRWDFETRQPQDFVRGVADKIVPPYTRPEQAGVFVPRNYISTTNSGGGAGVTIDTGINLAPVATVTDSFSYTRTVVSVATIPANALGSRVINVKLLG